MYQEGGEERDLFVFLFPDWHLHDEYISSDLDIIMIFYQTPAHHDAIRGEIERQGESEVEGTCKRCNDGRVGGGLSCLAIGSLEIRIHQQANARHESWILFHQSRLKLTTSTMKIIARFTPRIVQSWFPPGSDSVGRRGKCEVENIVMTWGHQVFVSRAIVPCPSVNMRFVWQKFISCRLTKSYEMDNQEQ